MTTCSVRIMKYIKTIILISISICIFIGWFFRGIYDNAFMMTGLVHIINNTKNDHAIDLKFPSGKVVNFNLKVEGFADQKVTNTGEGGIIVTVDGKDRSPVGYVTTMNNPIVLVINDDSIGFSQIFPSLITEPKNVADR